MQYENIKYEKKEGKGYVYINRPKTLNALNTPTMDELLRVFNEIKNDPEVFVVILSGVGDKAFVAGADINELVSQNPIDGKDYARKGQKILSFIENLGKPVIAAINGYALGGGCELALACTIRIASENAKFGQPEVKLGLIPGYGGTQRLPRIVGKGRAMEIILTGDPIGAQDALRIGLVNKVVKQEELIPTAEKIANSIMARGPVAIRLSIESVNYGMEMGIEEGLEHEATLFGLVCTTEDKKEGTIAFLEKRDAKFKGI